MTFTFTLASLIAQLVENQPAMQETPGLISGSGRSTGEGIGDLFQYSVLENSMDCIVHGVTRLSDFHFHFVYKEIRSLSDMSYNSFSQFVIYLLTLRYFSLPEILHGNIVKFIIICPH